jgi:hypothetical protein
VQKIPRTELVSVRSSRSCGQMPTSIAFATGSKTLTRVLCPHHFQTTMGRTGETLDMILLGVEDGWSTKVCRFAAWLLCFSGALGFGDAAQRRWRLDWGQTGESLLVSWFPVFEHCRGFRNFDSHARRDFGGFGGTPVYLNVVLITFAKWRARAQTVGSPARKEQEKNSNVWAEFILGFLL